jgi:hypothetical protein
VVARDDGYREPHSLADPGNSVWWGIGILVLGIAVLYVRRDDVSDAFSAMDG